MQPQLLAKKKEKKETCILLIKFLWTDLMRKLSDGSRSAIVTLKTIPRIHVHLART